MITKEFLIEEHVVKKRTLISIAKELGITRGGVKYHLQKHGIQIVTKKGKQHEDLTKQKFGRLTVEYLVKEEKYHSQNLWFCRCECGNTVKICSQSLKGSRIKSCGCLNQEKRKERGHQKFTGNKYLTGKQLGSIIQNAMIRGVECLDKTNLSSILENIFEKQNFKCAYTGEKLCFYERDDYGNIIPTSGNASVDRIDSSKGYIKDNIQIVHKDINRLKNDWSEKEFLNLIKKIYDFSIKGNNNGT